MKNAILWLAFLGHAFTGMAQNYQDLEKYYPDKVEPIEIKVIVHVLQYSATDPRNFTPVDSADIHTIFNYANQMYNTLGPPSLKVANVPFFDKSKINFAVQKILFHVDSVGWKVDWIQPESHMKIDRFDARQKQFKVKGNYVRYYTKKEGIHLQYRDGKGLKLSNDTTYYKDGYTYVSVNENVDTTGMDKLGYMAVKNVNCETYNYETYGRSDPGNMHVFLTQSTLSNIVFGCGPSKDYLNLSNCWKGNYWVCAQLMAHELGHCLGLSHTDTPQFPDLPRKDRFGWLPCDSVDVSNNIMGYNVCRNYLSPMQMGAVHRAYRSRPDYIGLTTNGKYIPGKIFDVEYDTTLDRFEVLNGDIIVRKRCALTIRKITYITSQTRIILEDGAGIIVDGGGLMVLDKKENNNIIYCRKYGSAKPPRKKGIIKSTNNGKITGIPNY